MKKVCLLCLCVLFYLSGGITVWTEPREINFSGYTWRVKYAGRPKAPGPNIYSNAESAVWADAGGLHLTVGKQGDNWYCSEVFTRTRFGYGTYRIRISAFLGKLSPPLVLGLFTYDTSDSDNHFQEIDIEFSRWGDPEHLPGNYSVQPYTVAENTKTFNVDPGIYNTTHVIHWKEDSVSFLSYTGHGEYKEENEIHSFTYTGKFVPRPKKPAFRINLWLFRAEAPADFTEIIIREFTFLPEK